MTAAFLTGLFTALGLIVAIGAQNAFVIRQGLLRQRVFAVATICFLCDAALIGVGVAGIGALIAQSPWLTRIAAWGGAVFLAWVGARALHNALRRDHKGLDAAQAEGRAGTKSVIAATLAFSLLNPHVYLDTVILMGGIGAQYGAAGRWAFFAGGILGSCLWFYGIGFGAMLLTPVFRRPIATRLLDGFVAAVMFLVAALLVTGTVGGG